MERKEGGQVTHEKTKSPENREAQLRNAVTERGIRLTAGGEFLDTINPQNAQQQAELTQKVSDIIDGKEPGDPKIAQAIGLYSDQDRANHWGNTPFEEAKRQARDDFTQWAIYTKTLENTDRQDVYEDTVAVLGQLDVTIENFATLSQEDRNSQFSHLYATYYARGTDVEAIGNAFLRTARNTDDTIDVLLLQRRLASLDPFLITCGTEAKAAVREYVLKQGFINGDKQSKDVFKQAASTVVHSTLSEKRDPVLKQVYDAYKKIAEEQLEQPHKPEPSQTVPANDEQTSMALTQPEASSHTVSRDILPDLSTHTTQEKPENMRDGIPHAVEPDQRSIPDEDGSKEQYTQPTSDIQSTPIQEKVVYTPTALTPLPVRSETIQTSPANEEQKEWSGKLQVGSESIPKPEEGNEDAKFVREDKKIFGVFDGVGGSDAGEIASQTASSIIEKALLSFPDQLSESFSEDDAKLEMARILQAANKELVKESKDDSMHRSMETTASVVKILNSGLAIIGNVGDSRVYVSRNGILEPITLDDGGIRYFYPDNQVKALGIQKRIANAKTYDDIPDEESDFLLNEYKYNLRQSLGAVSDLEILDLNELESLLEPRIYTAQLNPGDVLLLTTDGIHDNATDKEMEELIISNRDHPDEAARTLVQKAEEISKMDYGKRIGKSEYNGRSLKKKHDDGFTAIVIAINQ